MKIQISKDNVEYIKKLKERGFRQIHNNTRNKNLLLFTDVEVHDYFLVKEGIPPYKKLLEDYSYSTKEICQYCNKLYHWKGLQQHIRKIHLK